MTTAVPALLALASLMTISGPAAAASPDLLAAHAWRDRVVVALARSASDPALREQRRLFARMGPEARDRDLVLVVALDGSAEAAVLRRRFGGQGFRAVLVGKDGGAKLSADRPLGADDLFPLIDAMPMRRSEVERGR